ncbi:Pyrokinin-1 receptor, partial [Biomphalaria glabrata]
YMRTVTNYYLFNLSISDLLLLLMGLPMEIYLTWSQYPFPFGEAFCRFRFWASEVSSNVSVLTITAFTVERYMAICHPIRFPTH